MSLILKAAVLARTAHAGQLRKYNGRPYIEHPARIAGKMAIHSTATEDLIAAAFLHDVIEDTSVTSHEIARATNEHVASLVRWLTNPSKGSKAPRAVRKQMDRDHLKKAPDPVKILKMLDRIDNLLEMSHAPKDFRKLYGQESLLLVEAIGAADQKLADDLVALSR